MAKWPISRIRFEIARLDKITGLNGQSLEIRIGKATQTLGSFESEKGKPKRFRFSAHFFESDDFSHAAAIDTIRHEYSHYMVLMTYGRHPGGAHGNAWKKCCRRVGARPERCYSEEWNQEMLSREKEIIENWEYQPREKKEE
jgi:hypothetical protein